MDLKTFLLFLFFLLVREVGDVRWVSYSMSGKIDPKILRKGEKSVESIMQYKKKTLKIPAYTTG